MLPICKILAANFDSVHCNCIMIIYYSNPSIRKHVRSLLLWISIRTVNIRTTDTRLLLTKCNNCNTMSTCTAKKRQSEISPCWAHTTWAPQTEWHQLQAITAAMHVDGTTTGQLAVGQLIRGLATRKLVNSTTADYQQSRTEQLCTTNFPSHISPN